MVQPEIQVGKTPQNSLTTFLSLMLKETIPEIYNRER